MRPRSGPGRRSETAPRPGRRAPHSRRPIGSVACSRGCSHSRRRPPQVEEALRDLGKPGGILDAKDALDRGPALLITEAGLSEHNPNNPDHAAGTTFVGQFLDHDMTFDVGSRLGRATEPHTAVNARTPGLRPRLGVRRRARSASPLLYDAADRAKLRIESGGVFEDLPRTADGTAIVADPRNDEHLVIAGLQCAFILFHNRAVDLARAVARGRSVRAGQAPGDLALPLGDPARVPAASSSAGRSSTTSRRRAGASTGRGSGAFMPVEFQGAVYRFGHSMVRPSYRANLRGDRGRPFFGFIFDPAASGPDPADLRGGCRARAALRRLADLLRLRRRRGEAEQAHRHEDLDAALPPAARRDRQSRPADVAAAAEPAAPADLEASLRPVDREGGWACRRSRPPTFGS